MVQFGVYYDFRRDPNRVGQTFEQRYQEVLEQVDLLRNWGYESIWLTEHHCTDDGYLPSPLPMIGALSQRAPGLHYGTDLAVAPFGHPLRLAEDAATVAMLTEGRFTLGLGGGYVQREFDAFGVNPRNRPSLVTETVEILRRAFTGETFSYAGRRFQLKDAKVTPVPATPPRIGLGGMAPAAIDRAIALGDGFMGAWPSNLEEYAAGLARAGMAPTDGVIEGMPVWLVIADDPEREWARVGDHALYMMNTYADWGAFPSRFNHRDELLGGGLWQCVEGTRAIEEIVALVERFPQIQDLHFFGFLPGEPSESANERLEYISAKILPELRSRLAPAEEKA